MTLPLFNGFLVTCGSMARIQQLDPHVINRIAAGEVIERPASVVKELLENSVDALATRVEVDIYEGGLQLIRISDNGEGIHRDDMLLAVTSHATSKIRSDADLDHVNSLGFRGEALASIASVSRFRIRTRQEDETVGRELECNGGQITIQRECGCPVGTVMEVHHLFFNTPARRKFMKKASTEFGHISEYFARIALPNPALHMVLRHNDKLVYELPATSNQLDRIRRFYGSEVADQLIPVESVSDLPSGESIRLWGYVGSPTLSKSTRKNQYLFLNGRSIQDRSLQHALQEAYRGLLMVGRHPVSFLFLELPPALVDVNVHPTKTEVRFQDSQTLYRQLLHTLRDKFLKLEFRSTIEVPQVRGRQPLLLNSRISGPSAETRELGLWAENAVAAELPRIGPLAQQTDSPEAIRLQDTAPETASNAQDVNDRSIPANDARPLVTPFQPFPDNNRFRVPASPGGRSGIFADETSPPSPSEGSSDAGLSEKHSRAALSSSPAAEPNNVGSGTDPQGSPSVTAEREEFSANAIIGAATAGSYGPMVMADEFRAFQIHDCYLVVATDEGLEVIDQHALHERILYEHLRHRILGGGIERQKLLIPDPIECSAGEAAVLQEYQDLLREIGFEVEEFGGTTMLLTSYPVLIPRGDLARIVRDLAGQLEQSDGRTTRRDLLDHMLHTMACRAAIKSGQRLTLEEMQELLRQRHLVDDSHHCPHGRPTALTLTRDTLDQQFGRLG
ncbi:MAG: DNA mismatch repair endonuclease MutL [Planctomycetaceae bacterium]